MTTTQSRTFPPGVTCWIDHRSPDPGAAAAFYRDLLGWRTTPGDDRGSLVATSGGEEAAGFVDGEGTPTWVTSVAVSDADATLARAVALGGQVLRPATDVGAAGRSASLADPLGHEIALWQPGRRTGVQVANLPGAWNFSNLRTPDPSASLAFYGELFGWAFADQGWATAIQVPGYGDHLEATIDPDIRSRQEDAPDGFEDTIGAVVPAHEGDEAGWYVVLTVVDRDDAAATAQRLGARVLSRLETEWTREAVIHDPQGAVVTLSQFTPPTEWG